MMARNVFILAALLLSLAFMNTAFADDVSDKAVTVEAEGSGSTKMEALQAAWMEAVRKGVGMYMSSKTEAVDDKLTEQVVLHSRGQVNAYSVLSETKENGIWNVRIRANIDKDILQETAEATQTIKLKLDGKDLAANLDTLEKKADTQKLALEEVKKILDLSKIIDYTSSIEKYDSKGEKFYYVKYGLKMNLDKWLKQTEQAENILNKICSGKKSIDIRNDYAKKMLNELRNLKLNNNSTFGYFIEFRTSCPELKNRVDDAICIFKSISKAECYIFEPKVVSSCFTHNKEDRYNIQFKCDYGSGLEAMEVKSREGRFIYPYTDFKFALPYIYPAFGPGNAIIGLQYNQKLDLSPDQLLKINEIKTDYTITRGN